MRLYKYQSFLESTKTGYSELIYRNMISRYNNFILEKNLTNLILEAEVTYYGEFKTILNRMNSPVAKDLLELEFKDLKIATNFINLGDNDDEVTFYAANAKLDKYQILDPGYTYSSRVALFRNRGLEGDYYPSLPQYTIGNIEHIFVELEIAHFISDAGEHCFIAMKGLRPVPSGKPQKSFVGRVARRILEVSGKKYSDKELEDFVNEFKSKISIQKNREQLFELVDGEKIRYFYHKDRYDQTKSGPLHESCMRYVKCQKYLGIYVSNSKVCKLLILKSTDNQELIVGRALVWTLDNGDTFMDRIYYCYDSDVNLFKEYAIKNGWCYKKNQNSDTDGIEWKKGKMREDDLIVKLEYASFDDYPYMDTLKYLNEYEQTISSFLIDYDSDLTLDSTHGGRGECERCNGDGQIDCPECDGDERVDCPECDGDGTEECSECRGRGEIDCSSCDGEKNVDCSSCDGTGKIEGDDEEEIDCPDCSGKGKEKCSDCEGSGKEECSDCDGRGENSCSECSGDGKVECQRCDGEGRIDCPECS